jgi:hypothetical protein
LNDWTEVVNDVANALQQKFHRHKGLMFDRLPRQGRSHRNQSWIYAPRHTQFVAPRYLQQVAYFSPQDVYAFRLALPVIVVAKDSDGAPFP